MNQKVRTGAMGASWRIFMTAIGILLQIQALMSVKMKAVGMEGQKFTFTCNYSDNYKMNNKYFCLVDEGTCSKTLIRTDRNDQWEVKGRFSMYDNTTASFFTVRMNKLTLEDSGTYWCGVDISDIPDLIIIIQLNVTRATASLSPPTTTAKTKTAILENDPTVIKVPKRHLPLYLTAVMCVTAIFSVCIFTLCLLLVVKKQRSGPSHNRETSDYETMVPGSRPGPELRCSCLHLDCSDPAALPPPPPDLCAYFKSEARVSVVSLSTVEYVNMDVPGHVCPYQHLDLEHIEDHVYHCLHDNKSDKNEQPSASKEKNNMQNFL